jgi:hypothetical protein
MIIIVIGQKKWSRLIPIHYDNNSIVIDTPVDKWVLIIDSTYFITINILVNIHYDNNHR